MNDAENSSLLVASFYKFVSLTDFDSLRAPLLQRCRAQGIYGTILLAPEGINGTVAGPEASIRSLLDFLRSDSRLSDLEHKESRTSLAPFLRMKVRLKKEIVTMGVDDVDAANNAGTYVDADEWNELIQNPDVIVIDTRNDYEVEIGTFTGAINPSTDSFSELPNWLGNYEKLKTKPAVAMFCTGGIRCEKSTSFLKSRGFDSVYHLKGGILKYLETVDKQNNQFRGECFVFDERVSVTDSLEPGTYILCRACRMPVSPQQRESKQFEEGISCPHCIERLTPERRASLSERQRQTELARIRNVRHVGADYSSVQRSELPSSFEDAKHEDLPILYSFRRCPYAMRARMSLLVSQQKCALREIVLRDKPQSMLEASAKAEVPVLVFDDGTVIDESLDVMRWSLKRHDPDNWLSPPVGSVKEMYTLIAAADGDFKFHLDRYKYSSRYEGAQAEQHRSYGAVFLHRLHSRLLASDYLCGPRLCLADIAIFPFVRQFANTDRQWFDEQPWQQLRVWLDGLLESEMFLQSMFKFDVWTEDDAVVVFPQAEFARADRGDEAQIS